MKTIRKSICDLLKIQLLIMRMAAYCQLAPTVTKARFLMKRQAA
jgi:hypothetical protein